MKKSSERIKRIGFVANSEKVLSFGTISEAAQLVRKTGRAILSDAETASLAHLKGEVYTDAASLARHSDLLLVFGGDGTMLRVAREIAGSRTPMLGVNIGSLGFLTAVPSTELPETLSRIWRGEFDFEQRVLVQARGQCCGKSINHSALNDFVLSRGIASRLIELEVRVDGNLLTRYRCDGLIISSATGSTAYSLAAGGAVIFPTANVLAITPICPHTLSNRALILPLSARIDVTVVSPKPSTILSADGCVVGEMSQKESISFGRSRRTVRLMHLKGSSFCETLRKKLHWRGATI